LEGGREWDVLVLSVQLIVKALKAFKQNNAKENEE